MNGNRLYELVYIMAPESTDQEVTDLHDQVQAIVGRMNGQIQQTENWGRRRLAYEIGRHKEGVYVVEQLTGSGDLVKELDRRLKVNDRVIRHLIVRVDEEMRVADRAKARRQAHSDRRRAVREAKGLVERAPEAPDGAEASGAPRDKEGVEAES